MAVVTAGPWLGAVLAPQRRRRWLLLGDPGHAGMEAYPTDDALAALERVA